MYVWFEDRSKEYCKRCTEKYETDGKGGCQIVGREVDPNCNQADENNYCTLCNKGFEELANGGCLKSVRNCERGSTVKTETGS